MSKEIQNKTVNLKQWQDGNEPPFNPEMEVEIKDFIGVFKKAFTKFELQLFELNNCGMIPDMEDNYQEQVECRTEETDDFIDQVMQLFSDR